MLLFLTTNMAAVTSRANQQFRPLPFERGLRLEKQQILHVHHAFLYISLPSLHDYDAKMPNFLF